ncbi:methionine synthase (B12-independent) [Syntrophus gentianae]|uniref:5-methyltetrahydropteroyltriglutamate--homocysteine methyltransferase n=1 Tax=Syntrophus gentianae TaxID=43775 RepID=A0A1H8A383_9BACT|nr:5-methyltetrahydropteroyltriglutamate--homocysteine S-methyltransferase [Syntrophus gentianae]SEM64239.1 methionine synthase (B12-independent) [Syntrophus gentianae]
MKTHVLGFPRIGARRELKKALEDYWAGSLSPQDLISVSNSLKERHWKIQKDSGLSYVATGDFSLYDHVLDTSVMLGAVPERYGAKASGIGPDTYFQMARGDVGGNIAAMEMTKWFNTNYHYLVPEISPAQRFSLSSPAIVKDTRRAIELGYLPKPVLVGPITYLSLAKGEGSFNVWERIEDITDVYAEVIAELSTLCDWIQIDEPVLCGDLAPEAPWRFLETYVKLNQAVGKAGLLLTTYFDSLDEHLDLALSSGCAGLHIDLTCGRNDPYDRIVERLPEDMSLSVGLVDGRNIWKTDMTKALSVLRDIEKRIGPDRLLIASSCSPMHSPVDLNLETKLKPEIRSWMAFAVQKCEEVCLLGDALSGKNRDETLRANAEVLESRLSSPLAKNEAIRERCAGISEDMLHRKSPYRERKKAQSWLDLPIFPTTTIGSFPQTPEIRKNRLLFKRGELSRDGYKFFIEKEIHKVVKIQEELGLDVLVHGEPERNDMVEYFGERMGGFCFTDNGWVQSYGSRCVKPPVIYGDVFRRAPMTVREFSFAQSLTSKPMKGMLTGPVTVLCWSFVRDDLDRSEVCRQIAFALRDEVLDLERSGAKIIQIDEPALREGLPLKGRDAEAYLRWAVEAFRITSSGVDDETQIHTHMCYSEFNAIIQSIAEMDADVISIESSRSRMELLDVFRVFEYPNEIGPGVYDIHSPRVPTEAEIMKLIQRAAEYIPKERLWINPDCGLKTRGWEETLKSLKNMVAAAKAMRIGHQDF